MYRKCVSRVLLGARQETKVRGNLISQPPLLRMKQIIYKFSTPKINKFVNLNIQN